MNIINTYAEGRMMLIEELFELKSTVYISKKLGITRQRVMQVGKRKKVYSMIGKVPSRLQNVRLWSVLDWNVKCENHKWIEIQLTP